MIEDCEQVLKATTPSELFGTNEKRSKIIYRRLARAVHPDLYPDAEKKLASEAFVKLSEYWERYQNPRGNGSKAPKEGVIATSKHEYVLGNLFSEKGIYSRYEATCDAGHESVQVLITKEAVDNDLTTTYTEALKNLDKVPERYRAFYPKLVESFRYRTSDNIDHSALVQQIPAGFVPMSRILEVYPQGIDGRDVAWIFKRVLTALGNAHDLSLVHGAATLDSFLILPEQHGIILSEWQYSVETGGVMKAIQGEYEKDYPETVFSKEPVDYRLDLQLAAKSAQRLLRPNAPRQFNAFFKACMSTKNFSAVELLREFDILLERLYGKPSFHPFTLNP
ncbi:MAG: hypothetical protein H9W81_14000 [Enterococcus sp.]|nr:hypothetical protein [Enterococcus sp.]